MGAIKYRRVTNILEVPPEVFVHFLGKGLVVHHGRQGEQHADSGMGESDGSLGVSAQFDGEVGDGELGIRAQAFADPDTQMQIEVDVGNGLSFDEYGQLDVIVGPGLYINEDGQVAVDVCVREPEIDHTQTTEYTRIIDSKLSIDAQKLTLTKTYQKYKVERSGGGKVLYITPCEVWEEKDEVVLHVPYGYNYSGLLSCPNRESTPTNPNFYQK